MNEVVGRFSEITINDSGNRLINVCKQHGLRICNTFFDHKNIHRFTWKRPSLG